MKDIKIDNCPFCGGEEFIDCKLSCMGDVGVSRKMRFVSLNAIVCRDCGSVVRTYCKEPEKLFPKKERRE